MPASEAPMLQYLYCIIRGSEPHEFVNRGIGEQGDVVHTVHSADLAAVVSHSPLPEYDPSRRNMMAHTRVLEEAMRDFTILPVRFGTVGSSAEDVQEKVLKRRHDELSDLLDKMEGRMEAGLKAFWFEGSIFKQIAEENPSIRRLRDSLKGRPPEATHFDRLRLGEMVETAMKKKREKDAELILGRLRPLACDHRANPVNWIVSDRMVINAAFLLDREREADFARAVQGLDAELGERLMFKYVVPAPPYNFVNITISWEEA